ncbi:Protein CBG20937 [Caenorhabditis briggsae]|uniref:RING-CH-type domain-containing protein n=2 Tax=Caenorhabditis briggsae TaxID=6238 RepID=A0AAE9DLW5_CAEBR|nr:Protein CBG20937 [Caenorhabditis briggsae]ULU07728.1 hypothetical protein L3Y34_019023 [Caenorhabditis briggsae]CAP37868.2 Protein CBG20937 [Caenorhabditis briggsae]
MGERIRLFSTASFVSPATTSRCSEPTEGGGASGGRGTTMTVTTSGSGGTVIGLAKSHSLNSFEDSTAPVFVSTTTTRCQSGRKSHQLNHQRNNSGVIGITTEEHHRNFEKKKSRIDAIGSLLSLPSHDEPMSNSGMDSVDLEKGLEKDVSQLGILCHHCSTTDLTCPKTQKELPSPSASSVYSLARSDMSNEPLCRICHCCWPPDSNDPLISPCRCSGSLQYVHVSCLMHWLDISSRKLHRPAICELCLYKYRRRRVLKYREMKLPQCAQADIRFYTLFVIAIVLMILSAFATVVCFQLEKSYGLPAELRNRTISPMNVEGVASDLSPAAPPPAPPSLTAVAPNTEDSTTASVVLGARKRIGDITVSASSKDEYGRRDDAENVLSTVTLIAAMVFFLSFFLAMYAHVKSGLSFCGYLTLCWSSNLEWSIEEYKHSRDTQYLNKLEELRRKINEKQKKAADEVEPLRSSVIVLE